MSIAAGSRHSVAYGLQTQFETPATSLTALRCTDCSLAPTRDDFESAELQPHGQVVDSRQGMHQAGGEVSFELSHGTFDDFLAGLLRNSWSLNSAAAGGATISAADGNKLEDSAAGFGFSARDWVKVSGFARSANNGIFEVVAASASSLTLAGPAMEAEAAGAAVSVEGVDVLKVGASEKYFSIQRAFEDVGLYEHYIGCAVSSLNLTIQPNQMVTGSFSIVAKDMAASDSALDASPAAAPASDVMSGIDVGCIMEGGAAMANVSGLNLSIEGAAAAKPVVGSNSAGFMAWTDAFRVSGSLDAYFENNAFMNKFLNESESSLRVVLQDPDGAVLGFELPRIKYTGASRPTSARDSIVQSAQIKALYDGAEGSTIIFFRKSA